MKHLMLLFSVVILAGCSSNKQLTTSVARLDSKMLGDSFIDSLKASGVDTIIGYYDGCTGCMPGVEMPYFVYWKTDHFWHTTKFTRYATYHKLTGYSPPIGYLSSVMADLQTEKLADPTIILSHFPFEIVTIRLGKATITYQLTHREKQANESAKKVVLIDKIRSHLFRIPPGEWKSMGQKH